MDATGSIHPTAAGIYAPAVPQPQSSRASTLRGMWPGSRVVSQQYRARSLSRSYFVSFGFSFEPRMRRYALARCGEPCC